ncbi:MAG: glycine cleavage system protein [Thermoleophilia bacterium]|nr:glycine cleavage system protein [Thermoleophilia bacterium]
MEGDLVALGITDHAQHALGDVVHFEPPALGEQVRAGGSYGELESVKTVSDLVAPVGGTVTEVNAAVITDPEQLNDAPYSTWLIRLQGVDAHEYDELLSAEQYAESL